MPFKIHDKGITATVKLMPGARKTECAGVGETAEGPALKIFVNAAPEDGKANKALVDFLAGEWGLPKGAFSLLSGDTRRLKVVLVKGDGKALMEKVAAWLGSISV